MSIAADDDDDLPSLNDILSPRPLSTDQEEEEDDDGSYTRIWNENEFSLLGVNGAGFSFDDSISSRSEHWSPPRQSFYLNHSNVALDRNVSVKGLPQETPLSQIVNEKKGKPSVASGPSSNLPSASESSHPPFHVMQEKQAETAASPDNLPRSTIVEPDTDTNDDWL